MTRLDAQRHFGINFTDSEYKESLIFAIKKYVFFAEEPELLTHMTGIEDYVFKNHVEDLPDLMRIVIK